MSQLMTLDERWREIRYEFLAQQLVLIWIFAVYDITNFRVDAITLMLRHATETIL